jgi:hypothetical protein
MNKEKWLPIIGFEGLYEISSKGNVKSLYFNKERIMKPCKDGWGYLTAYIAKDNIKKRVKIHRFVALYFVPNQDKKPFVNHIDNNKLNNNAENLEWCTQKENIQHAIRQNRMVHGEQQHCCKLTSKDVLEIRESKLTHLELSKKYKVHSATISAIKTRKIWKHL